MKFFIYIYIFFFIFLIIIRQLQDNELSGTIPPELGKLSKLTIM